MPKLGDVDVVEVIHADGTRGTTKLRVIGLVGGAAVADQTQAADATAAAGTAQPPEATAADA